LKSYRRVELAPGESRTVEFTIGREELSFMKAEKKASTEPARATVWIAPDAGSGTGVDFQIK
jgi:beta-glucosidase